MNSEDPRMGVPSASSMARLMACPGSWWLSKDLPDSSGEDAASGTRIHKWLETYDPADWEALSMAEQDTANAILFQRIKLMASYGNITVELLVKEMRFYLMSGGECFGNDLVSESIYGKPIFSGQADLIYYFDGNKCLIIDYKTGRNEPAAAEINEQLMALAALVSTYLIYEFEIHVAIITPNGYTIAKYDKESQEYAKKTLGRVLGAIKLCDKNPIRQTKAGNHCHYCKYMAQCPTYAESINDETALLGIENLPEDNKEARNKLFGRAMNLAPDWIADALNNLHKLKWYEDAIKSAARQFIEQGTEIPGWELRATKGKRTIIDPVAASEVLAGHISQEALISCASISAAALTDELRKSCGLKQDGKNYVLSAAKAKAMLAEILGDNMTAKEGMTLRRLGEALEE